MKRVDFQDGQLVKPATVTINEVEHTVKPAQYSGTTPISKRTLNLMQDNIEEEIDLNKIHTYTMTVEADIELRSRSRVAVLVQGTVMAVCIKFNLRTGYC